MDMGPREESNRYPHKIGVNAPPTPQPAKKAEDTFPVMSIF